MDNVLTIDLEEWYHANYDERSFDPDKEYEERVVGNTEKLLDMFERSGAAATFFTLGVIADKYPELLRSIRSRGHEIATHGYGHGLVYNQTEQEFEEDLQRSIEAIERAIGCKPIGYRAPSWSVSPRTTWFPSVLLRNGIRYDASVFPVRTFLYGIPDAPRFPFVLTSDDGELLEFPTSTYRMLNRNIPFSGGFYLRFLPYSIIRLFFRKLNSDGRAVICYLHPREIDPGQPKLESLGRRDAFIHSYGLNGCEAKLAKLLQQFRFVTAEKYLFLSNNEFGERWRLEQSRSGI